MELLLELADVMEENAEELWPLSRKTSVAGVDRETRLRFPSTTSGSSPALRATSRRSAPPSTSGVHVDRPARAARVAGVTPSNYPLMMIVWKLGLRSPRQR